VTPSRFRIAAALTAGLSAAAAVAAEPARVAIQVDQQDPAVMNLALNNAANIISHYEAEGRPVEVEIVAYGPGLDMLRVDASPVRERIGAMSLEHENLKFSACGNTIAGVTRREGAAPPIMSEAVVVSSGAVRLMELQEQGWTYLRP
jgi:intracellular sulfur oxidation DsrE/DsrF family protein